jgi:succinate-semialdehyde dehydrogenase/glutarate-semialdehyde dehydrogenase
MKVQENYPEVLLHIDGVWCAGAGGVDQPVLNPATGEPIGRISHACRTDLDRALAAALTGFRAVSRSD